MMSADCCMPRRWEWCTMEAVERWRPPWFIGGGLCALPSFNNIRLSCSLFVLVLHPEPPCVSQKMGNKRKLDNGTGKLDLLKANLHMYIFAMTGEFLAGQLDLPICSLWFVLPARKIFGRLPRSSNLQDRVICSSLDCSRRERGGRMEGSRG